MMKLIGPMVMEEMSIEEMMDKVVISAVSLT